jgi:hypothetical protein
MDKLSRISRAETPKPAPPMKYFPYELIAAVNDWIDQTRANQAKAEKQLSKAAQKYHRELDRLKPRIGQRAWGFFRHGFGPTGLHDGRLLAMRIGDGIDYVADGTKPFRLNHQKLTARLEFLNYEQDFHYVFDLRGVGSIQSDLFLDDCVGRGVGDLYTYEILAIDDDNLQLAFLFASGALVIVQFRKLVFKRRRVDRRYNVNEIYN